MHSPDAIGRVAGISPRAKARRIGALGVIGGLGWLTHRYEPLAARLIAVVVGAAIPGGLVKVGWLRVVGVDERPWQEQAARMPA